MRKNYLQPTMTIENVELSSHLLDGSVLGVGGGSYQEGALAPKRGTPIEP